MKMKTKTLLPMFVLIALLFVTGGASAQPLNKAEGSNAASVSLGTAFTYQGQLKKSGTPVTNTCAFTFGLWDAASGGTQLGSNQAVGNVSVSNGLFTAQLNGGGEFGANAFNGDARWLQISVQCSGDASVTDLGRQQLTATPYALSLRPGANISGSSTEPVWKVTNSSTGHGLMGTTTGTDHLHAGVTGTNQGAGSGSGVYGFSIAGYGVLGRSTNSYAIYSDGKAHVEGNLTWKARTSYISVAAAAFRPYVDGYDFSNDGRHLWNVDSNSDFYLAPVQLPHGAIVTKLTFYWWDGSASEGYCELYRIDLADNENTMATASTYGSAAAPNASVDSTIDLATVDNSSYAYYLWLNLPDGLVRAFGVVIEYTISEPY